VTHQDGKYFVSSDLGIWFDVAEFLHVIDHINDSSKEMSQKAVLLQKAIDMYKGPFLPNIYSEWVENRRWELENKCIKALHILARYYFENNELTKVFDILEKISSIDPYDDELLAEIQEQALSQKTVNLLLKKYKQHIDLIKQDHTKVLTYRHRSIT
jgi:two-component SAPR family response regulator